MPQQFVTDIRHHLNEDSDFPDGLHKPALKMASYLAMLIETATKPENWQPPKATPRNWINSQPRLILYSSKSHWEHDHDGILR